MNEVFVVNPTVSSPYDYDTQKSALKCSDRRHNVPTTKKLVPDSYVPSDAPISIVSTLNIKNDVKTSASYDKRIVQDTYMRISDFVKNSQKSTIPETEFIDSSAYDVESFCENSNNEDGEHLRVKQFLPDNHGNDILSKKKILQAGSKIIVSALEEDVLLDIASGARSSESNDEESVLNQSLTQGYEGIERTVESPSANRDTHLSLTIDFDLHNSSTNIEGSTAGINSPNLFLNGTIPATTLQLSSKCGEGQGNLSNPISKVRNKSQLSADVDSAMYDVESEVSDVEGYPNLHSDMCFASRNKTASRSNVDVEDACTMENAEGHEKHVHDSDDANIFLKSKNVADSFSASTEFTPALASWAQNVSPIIDVEI